MAEAALASLVSFAPVIQAGAAVVGGLAAFQQSRFQAAVASANAKAAKQQAQAEEIRLRRDRVRRIAATRAAFGAAGVALAGTPLDVLAEQALEAEEDALLTRFGGRVRARAFRFQAGAARAGAGGALLGGALAATGTLLGSPLFRPAALGRATTSPGGFIEAGDVRPVIGGFA